MPKSHPPYAAEFRRRMVELARLVRERPNITETGHDVMAMGPSKLADRCDACVSWSPLVECPTHYLTGNALPMGWDFGESSIICDSSASVVQTFDNVAGNTDATVINGVRVGSVQLADASNQRLPNETAAVWLTDPPYYDAVPYSDLSDLFFVWLKRTLPGHPLLRDPFDLTNPLTPKTQEAVQDETKRDNGRAKDRGWFEETMAKVFAEGRRVPREDGVGSVVFAHKTTEGWEALLSGMIRGGWTITGSWPIATEMGSRLTALFLWTLQSTNGEAADGASDEGEEAEPSGDEEEDDAEDASRRKAKGFTLLFDVVRRFAQPLGIELPRWEKRIIETKKGVVCLLPVAERARQLFGEHGAQAVAARLEQEAADGPASLRGVLFPEMEAAPRVRGRGARGRGKRSGADVSDESLAAAREATTLDRVHAAMLVQAGGRTNALRALVAAEQGRGPDFLRLANALSALYPKGSEEKRLLDAMLLAVPR